jgi:HTH-type transcriptional regulator / antitoxin HigA
VEIMSLATKDLETHWSAIRPLLAIHNEDDYDRAVAWLNELIDEVGTDESPSLYDLLDTLGTLLHVYEEAHHQLPDVSGTEVLRFFMDEHGLTQSDLPEIGSQGVVSEILSGKRQLNVRQIRALAERFNVSPAVFL